MRIRLSWIYIESSSNDLYNDFGIKSINFYGIFPICKAFKFGTDTQGDFRNIIAWNLVLGGIPEQAIDNVVIKRYENKNGRRRNAGNET